jgi:serine/threonine-protein kinase
MKTSLEIKVLQLFEQALAQPVADRMAWLAGQDLPTDMVARVMRLLEAERAATGFMEQTAVVPDEVPPEFPKVGERLGNWELLKPLEAGGMGVVYLGRRADDVYDQQVAIKLVRPVHLLAAADFRRRLISRFEDERSILARMSHPNVARILDGGSTAGGIPYLVMEYVDGVSLTDYCRNHKLDVPARLALFCKVCDGVQEAHRHLIVHRDLKPDNVLVGADGEPRLLDFGIAKILEQEPLEPGKGTSLSAMTPAYASPEQVRQEALTTSSDVYSLGVVLYQLLAGVRPYELGGLRPAEAEHIVCDTLPDPMGRMLAKAAIPDAERKLRQAQITSDVERIVAKAMHKEAPRRYGSAQDLADDIRRYLAGEPVHAHPDSTGYRLRKFLGRHRIGAMAATLALLAILAASGVAFWQAGEARRAAADTQQVNNFLLDMLKVSDPFSAGVEISLSQAVDDSADSVDRRFSGRPDLSARVRMALGYSMLSRGRLEPAERQLELALRDALQAFGPTDVKTLKVREAIAQLRKEQGRLDEAEAMLRDLLSTVESGGLRDDPVHALVLSNLGELLLRRDDYATADRYFRQAQALPVMNEPGRLEPTDHAALLSSLAYAADGLGDLARSEALYRQAIAELEALDPGGSPELATALGNLAGVLDQKQGFDEAYQLRKRSVEMREQAFKGGHPTLVTALIDLSNRAVRQGEVAQAVAAARRAQAMALAISTPDDPLTIYTGLVLAGALVQAADYPAAAQALAAGDETIARLPPEMKNLRNLAASLREDLCGRAATSPGCPGVAPTPPKAEPAD